MRKCVCATTGATGIERRWDPVSNADHGAPIVAANVRAIEYMKYLPWSTAALRSASTWTLIVLFAFHTAAVCSECAGGALA